MGWRKDWGGMGAGISPEQLKYVAIFKMIIPSFDKRRDADMVRLGFKSCVAMAGRSDGLGEIEAKVPIFLIGKMPFFPILRFQKSRAGLTQLVD